MVQEPFDQFAISLARESWDVFRRDPALFVIAGVVYWLAAVLSLGLLAGPVWVGYVDLVRRVRAGETVAVSAIFHRFDSLVPSGVVFVISFALIWIGMLLLVLPGLLAMLFLSLAPMAVAYEKIGGVEAIRRSIAIVKLNFMPTLALLTLVWIVNALGSLLMIGLLLSTPLTVILFSLGYERLSLAPAPETLTI
jgi:hypothetical protein